jgi:hypothetical protein
MVLLNFSPYSFASPPFGGFAQINYEYILL